jgi:hypothetical protein
MLRRKLRSPVGAILSGVYAALMPHRRTSGPRRLRDVPQQIVRYRVLLRVPRVGGLREWGAASAGFEAALSDLPGMDVPGAHGHGGG